MLGRFTLVRSLRRKSQGRKTITRADIESAGAGRARQAHPGTSRSHERWASIRRRMMKAIRFSR